MTKFEDIFFYIGWFGVGFGLFGGGFVLMLQHLLPLDSLIAPSITYIVIGFLIIIIASLKIMGKDYGKRL